ncbi:MAG: peptidase M61 [Flavobacteriaceae bacterium]|nr:peptidase M61 [Flavobacteriaceae bacterium]
MKQIIYTVGLSLFILSCGTKSTVNDLAVSNPIVTKMDLVQVDEDRVPVTIDPGRMVKDTVVYRLPKVVQGTYAISDFGNFIDEFKAIDYKGEALEVKKIDDNSWEIYNASNLDHMSYLVNDTFDVENGEIETPFSPSGTNIEESVYVLNLHGFIGYFDHLKNAQYSLDVLAPANFKRSSALQKINESLSEDGNTVTTSYFAPRYFDITDNPMMYGDIEVEEFQVGDITIVLSLYSPTAAHQAEEMKKTMFNMMEAQKAYLGDLNSTARYDIFVYLADMSSENSPQGFGALEHHTSTVVVMPDQIAPTMMAESMTDIVAHEFFHIVTPLSVHSEDVHYFDYDDPTFSKHLWMYEGVTEYFAQHFQVYEGLVSEEDFFTTIMEKINTSKGMDDSMSFTVMSENVLQEPYKTNYFNVYQKGALIGMCMDILLREGSEGNRSMLSLMKELSLKYGKNKPFNDDDLFQEIAEMTYPSVSSFIKTHVEGTTPIDYNVFFEKVGLTLGEAKVETNYIMNVGNIIVGANPIDGSIFFTDLVSNNSFWNDLGVQPLDVIKKVNGTEVTLENANDVFSEVFTWEPGREIEVVLDREGEEISIAATTVQSYTVGQTLVPDENASAEKVELRKAWLKG